MNNSTDVKKIQRYLVSMQVDFLFKVTNLAPSLSKGPGGGEVVVRGGEGDAEHDEENVSNLL